MTGRMRLALSEQLPSGSDLWVVITLNFCCWICVISIPLSFLHDADRVFGPLWCDSGWPVFQIFFLWAISYLYWNYDVTILRSSLWVVSTVCWRPGLQQMGGWVQLQPSTQQQYWSTWPQKYWSLPGMLVRISRSSVSHLGICSSLFVETRNLIPSSKEPLLEVESFLTSTSPLLTSHPRIRPSCECDYRSGLCIFVRDLWKNVCRERTKADAGGRTSDCVCVLHFN